MIKLLQRHFIPVCLHFLMINLLQRHFIPVCLHFLMINLWWVPADDASEGLSEARAGEIVDKQVHGGTHVGEELGQSQQKVKGAGEVSASSQSRFEHRRHTQADDGDGQQEELDGQSDEHFGDADLLAGQIGGRAAPPANGVAEFEGGDTGGYQHDHWAAHCETKPVKHAVQSADHGSVPEVVIVNV